MTKTLLALTISLFAGAALASGAMTTAKGVDWLENGALTYEVFEISVDHADLDTCPEGLDEDKVFCRLTLAAEQAHIFIFAHDGDQPLLGVRHVDLDAVMPEL